MRRTSFLFQVDGDVGDLGLGEADGFAVAISEFDGRYEFTVDGGDWEIIPDSEMHLALQGGQGGTELSIRQRLSNPDGVLESFAGNGFKTQSIEKIFPAR